MLRANWYIKPDWRWLYKEVFGDLDSDGWTRDFSEANVCTLDRFLDALIKLNPDFRDNCPEALASNTVLELLKVFKVNDVFPNDARTKALLCEFRMLVEVEVAQQK